MPGISLQKNFVKDRKKIPPFRIWLVTGVLFLSVIAGAHFLPDRTPTKADLLKNFNHTRVGRLATGEAEKGYPRVIVIGTSLTHDAFFFDEEMETFAVKNGFRGMQFVRFVKSAGRLEDFIPLLDYIKEAGPDFVFLESNLLGIDFSGGFIAREKDRVKLRLYIRKMFGKELPEPDNQLTGEQKFKKEERHQTNTDFINYLNGRKGIHLRQFSLPREYEIFFNDLQRSGSKIILLDMPRSARAVTAYTPEFLDEMRSLIKSYQTTYGLLHWEAPDYSDLEYYIDFVHLNKKGRNAYSLWFLSEFSRLSGNNSL